MSFSALLISNLKFYFQTKRFIIILPLYLVISIIFPILVLNGNIPKPVDVYSFTYQGLGNFAAASALVCALFAGDAISRDFSREGFFTLTQPVERYKIMFSRFLAAIIVALVTIMLSYFVPYVIFSQLLYSTVVPTLWQIAGIAVLYNISLIAFAMLFSSVFRSSTVSIILTVLALWLIMPAIVGILQFLGIEPWFLISYAGDSINSLALQNYPPHISTSSSPTVKITVFTPYVWESVAIMVGYLIFSLLIAYIIYSRRELKVI